MKKNRQYADYQSERTAYKLKAHKGQLNYTIPDCSFQEARKDNIMNIQLFKNETFGEIQSILIENKPYFEASAVARALGYSRPQDAVSRHCRYPHSVKRSIGVQTGVKADGTPAIQQVEKNFIPEGDIIRLVVRSKLPQAEKFESWIFDEVIPTILKTGSYTVPNIEGTPRQQLKNLISKYRIKAKLPSYEEAWHHFTEAYNNAYSTNLMLALTKSGKNYSRPQFLEYTGKLDKALAVAKRMLEIDIPQPAFHNTFMNDYCKELKTVYEIEKKLAIGYENVSDLRQILLNELSHCIYTGLRAYLQYNFYTELPAKDIHDYIKKALSDIIREHSTQIIVKF